MESGAWDPGTGSRLHGSWHGKGANLGGWGLSVRLYNLKALHAICSIYYLTLS